MQTDMLQNLTNASITTNRNSFATKGFSRISLGLLSGVLYISGLLAPVFLVPLQFEFRKEGKREGFVSLLVSLLVIGIGNAWMLSAVGAADIISVVRACLPPAIFMLAILILNFLPFGTWKKLMSIWLVLTAILGYLLATTVGSQDIQRELAEMVAQALQTSGIQNQTIAEIEIQYIEPALRLITNTVGVWLWCILAGTWYIGNRFAKRKAAAYRVPSWLIGPSLAIWIMLIIVLYGGKAVRLQ